MFLCRTSLLPMNVVCPSHSYTSLSGLSLTTRPLLPVCLIAHRPTQYLLQLLVHRRVAGDRDHAECNHYDTRAHRMPTHRHRSGDGPCLRLLRGGRYSHPFGDLCIPLPSLKMHIYIYILYIKRGYKCVMESLSSLCGDDLMPCSLLTPPSDSISPSIFPPLSHACLPRRALSCSARSSWWCIWRSPRSRSNGHGYTTSQYGSANVRGDEETTGIIASLECNS